MNQNDDKGLLLAAGEGEVSAKDIQAVRKAAQDFGSCLAGLVDQLDEPLKSKFLEVKGQINTMLAGMPETDKVPAAQESNYLLRQLLDVMTQAQTMISSLSQVALSAKKDVTSARASIPQEVAKAIEDKVKAGELLTPELSKTKIDEAVTAARHTFTEEQKQVSDRRTALAGANFPVPSDLVLAGKAEEFDVRKTKAAERVEKLKGFNLSSARVASLAWEADDVSFESTVSLLGEVKPAAATPKPGLNPYAKPATAGAKPDIRALGAL